MSFELFICRNKGLIPKIHKDGYLFLPGKIIENFGLLSYDYFNIYIDRETNRVGIDFIKEKKTNSYKILKIYRKDYLSFYKLHLRHVLKTLQITVVKAIVLDIKKQDNLYVFKLDNKKRSIK